MAPVFDELQAEGPFRIPAPVVVHLQERVGAVAGVYHAVALGQGEAHRLFADDRLHGGEFGAGHDHVGVKLGMRRDDADVRLHLIEHLAVVVIERIDAKALAEVLKLLLAAIDAGDELAAVDLLHGLGVIVGEIGEAELVADAAGADEGDAVFCHCRSLQTW